MPVRCQKEAEIVLGDHFDTFWDIVTSSVRDYYEFYGARAHLHEAWTRCSIIRDEIKDRLTEFSDKTPCFQRCIDGNTTYFGAHSKFLIRPKKLFDNLHANTGKTQLSFEYDHQIPVPLQLELFEELGPTNIYLGYVPTENDPLNPLVYLVCNNEAGKVEWSILLNKEPPPPSAVLEPPVPPSTGPEESQRIRVKKSDANKKANSE